ncbi:M50 family metallopeptidase [Mastigocoleus sp. MO_188.B34]|uniref:M50 family metallopeptidase n=1 Tax=Mastigocoleus sp. MO_188.B34 TaxID=3036635 RepID=UPI00260B3766|nr:M50 family metallopeptidase [Mastigocoleus sp. MO_188.B34]MDJ0697764.1 M50 family metallopeptidase [Mastigocoleus sp. MO_188.B34]
MIIGKSFVDYSWNDIVQWLKIDTLSSADRQELLLLSMIAVVSLALWQREAGREIIRPYFILGVFFHEVGHAIAVLMLGGKPIRIELNTDNSGRTKYRYYRKINRFIEAIVSAAGFLGTSIVGALLILASRNPNITNNILIILGIFSLVITIVWVREWFGYGFMTMIFWGLIILAIAFRTPPEVQKFMIQFLGVQISMINFLNIGYLFKKQGDSDVAEMEKYLFLPHWFWGIMVTLLCVAILVQSIRITYFSNYFQ